VRPQTSYGYSQYTSAEFTGTDAQFYLMTSKTEKISSTSSLNTSYGYEGSANRFALKDRTVDTAGLALRTCFKFSATGDLISTTEPKAALTSCP
jgi:hypothetical protein